MKSILSKFSIFCKAKTEAAKGSRRRDFVSRNFISLVNKRKIRSYKKKIKNVCKFRINFIKSMPLFRESDD